jgi:hypothetical protein
MKNAALIIIGLLFTISLNAQSGKAKIPAAVKESVAQSYPKVKVTEWEVEDGIYEASFKNNNIPTTIGMSADGRIIFTETEIDPEMIPQTAQNYISSNVKEARISSAEKIVDANGKVVYEVDVNFHDYIFDINGNFIRMEEKSADDDDHDDKK